MEIIGSIKSRHNTNTYELYEDRIVIKASMKTSEILLPKASYIWCFRDIYYMGDKLYVIAANRNDDIKYEIDEDTLELIGPTRSY